MTFRSSPPSDRGAFRGAVSSFAPQRASSSEVVILDAVPGAFHFGSCNNIMFAAWEAPADAISVSRLDALGKDFQRAHPGKRQSGIHIVREGVGLPTPEGRAGLMKMMKADSDHFGAIAVVICGSGFVASAVRSFLAGLRLLAPRTFEFRLHAKTSEILKWFPAAHFSRTGEQVDAPRLGRMIYTFETKLNWP